MGITDGLNINSGFGAEGTKSLLFWPEESRTVVNEVLFGA